jgi:nitrogen regulatory protein PII 2
MQQRERRFLFGACNHRGIGDVMSVDLPRHGPLDDERMRLAIRQEMHAQSATAPGMLRMWSSPTPHHEIRLKEVVAIIKPQRWSATKLRVQRLRVQAFTQQRVLGRGRARGLRYLPRKGAASGAGVRYLPKRMISWIVEAPHVEPLVRAIIETNQTGQLGDGKIFVLPVEGAVRIRTGDRHLEALRGESLFEMVRGTAPDARAAVEVAHASGQ